MSQDTVNVRDSSPDMFAESSESMEIDTICLVTKELPSTSGRITKDKQKWQGVPMCEIYRSRNPWAAPEYPLVIPAYNHAVLYHIPKTAVGGIGSHPPVPQQGRDMWDKEHVRMPFSLQSLYPIQEADGSSSLQNRWDLITEALSLSIRNSRELEAAILKYNTKYQNVWKFTALHRLFNEALDEEEHDSFFNTTLPKMIKLALRLPQLVPSSIPLLRHHHNRSVTLSQEQISCLLANAFFCTFPRRNTNKQKSEYSTYPDINFYRLFQCGQCDSVLEKLKCLFNYFRRVCNTVPCGVVTFTRRTVEVNKCPEWSKSNLLLGSIPLHMSSVGTIEDDGLGLLQVDFANKYLGGGVLGYGCVQEEIRFVICPELMVSMLFTEVLKPTEALLILGCERYNNYIGYAENFQWSGDYEDSTPYDSSGRRRCAVVAIDALCFSISHHQYKVDNITRELNKAWVGYSVYTDSNDTELFLPGVATGNWGCGAFHGSPHLKALIQLMACCQARRPMVYYTFDDVNLCDDVINMYNYLSQHNITVGELYKYLCQFGKFLTSGEQLYPFILQSHKDASKKCDSFKTLSALTSDAKANESDNNSEATGSNIAPIKKHPDFALREAVIPSKQGWITKNTNHKLQSKDDYVEPNVTSNQFLKAKRSSPTHKANNAKIQAVGKTSLCDELTQLEEGKIPHFSPLKRNTLPCFEPKTSTSSEYTPERRALKPSITVNDEKKPKATPQNSAKDIRKISDYFQRTKKN